MFIEHFLYARYRVEYKITEGMLAHALQKRARINTLSSWEEGFFFF